MMKAKLPASGKRMPVPSALELSPEKAPRDSEVRLGFARQIMSCFSADHGYNALAVAFLIADEDDLKGLFHARKIVENPGDNETYNYDGVYDDAIEMLRASGASANPTYMRLSEVVEDLLDWDGDDYEFKEYVQPAWRAVFPAIYLVHRSAS